MRLHASSASCALIAGLVALSSAAPSRAFVVTPHGANAGEGYYSILGLQHITGVGPAVPQTFSSTGAQGANHLKEDLWYWRVRGIDTRERAFGQGVSNGTGVVGNFVGNLQGTLDTGGMNYSVSGAGYSYSAQQRYTITKGTLGPTVDRTLTIINNSAATLAVNAYSYLDLDVDGVVMNQYTGPGAGPGEFRSFTLVLINGRRIRYEAVTNPRDGVEPVPSFQGGDAATLRALFTDLAPSELNNTVVGTEGDFAGAFQWDLEVAPGDSITVSTRLSFVPEPGVAALLTLSGVFAFGRRRTA